MRDKQSDTPKDRPAMAKCLHDRCEGARNAELAAMLYRVVHDLRAPLRAISALPGWIVEDLTASEICLPASIHHNLTEIERQARVMDIRLLGLVRYLNASVADETPRMCNTGTMLQGIVATLAGRQGVEVTVLHPLPHVFAAPKMLATALTALLDNAIGFAGKGGHVTVSGMSQPARLVIRDDGPGIDPAIVRDIFKPFFTTRPEAAHLVSCGMGLAIARLVIEANGGTLVAEPQAGESGATFTVTLPATPNDLHAANAPPTS